MMVLYCAMELYREYKQSKVAPSGGVSVESDGEEQ
jgi:hypothetical protein